MRRSPPRCGPRRSSSAPLYSALLDELPYHRRHRTIAAALALSLLVHVAVFWKWMPPVRFSSSDEGKRGAPADELIVRLVPRQRTVPSPPSKAAPTAKPLPPPRAAPKAPRVAKPAPPAPRPPVLALKETAPQAAPPVQRAPPAPPSALVTPPVGDLASYVEARRQARGEAAPAPPSPGSVAAADANARANQLAAANIAAGRNLTFGYDPRKSGGVFTLQRLTEDYAEFVFYGWQKEIKRNTAQVISVRRGNNSNIRDAVVRKMVAIIREYEQGDFVWESTRLGRDVTLSARARDNAGLEDFMMKEFFEDFRRLQ